MPTYENNIPTNETTFAPAGPSDIPSPIADIEVPSPYEEDDPARAVDDLVKSMMPQRKHLMSILRACSDRASVGDVQAAFDEVREYSPTVFTAYDLCVLLEEAGGIERVASDGSAYDMEAVEPIMVEDEATGAMYYEANEPDDMYWSILPAGQTVLDDDDPLARAQACFDADANLQPLYKRLLTLCGEGKGKTIEELDDALSYDDLAWEPRVYAAFFVDRMEKSDAIEWRGTWQTTETGKDALTLLDGVKDSYDAAQQAANKAAYIAQNFEGDDAIDGVEFEGTLIDQDAVAAAHVDDNELEGANYVTALGSLQ